MLEKVVNIPISSQIGEVTTLIQTIKNNIKVFLLVTNGKLSIYIGFKSRDNAKISSKYIRYVCN